MRSKPKRKICVITSNRTDYSRLKTVLEELDKIPAIQTCLVVAGSHLLEKYGNTIRDIERDGFAIDEKAYITVEGENPTTMAKSTGIAIIEFTTIFNNHLPDIVVVHGDRYDNFAAILAAALMNIPVAHIQGGEISGTIDESLRHAATKLSHIHFPSNEQSKKRIIMLGENPKTVFNVGCPATDMLLRIPRLSKEKLFKLPDVLPKDGRLFNPKQPLILAAMHPVTTEYGQSYRQMEQFLFALKALNMQTIMLYPNVDAGSEDMIKAIRRFLLKHTLENVFMYKNFYQETYIKILQAADVIIGNSSVGIRESCYFGIPSVNVGTREQNRQRGKNVIDSSYDAKDIVTVTRKQLKHGKYRPEYIYGDGKSGKRIAKILATIETDSIQKQLTY